MPTARNCSLRDADMSDFRCHAKSPKMVSTDQQTAVIQAALETGEPIWLIRKLLALLPGTPCRNWSFRFSESESRSRSPQDIHVLTRKLYRGAHPPRSRH